MLFVMYRFHKILHNLIHNTFQNQFLDSRTNQMRDISMQQVDADPKIYGMGVIMEK
jgi:hypothetical protein